jgi:hypothetical protein
MRMPENDDFLSFNNPKTAVNSNFQAGIRIAWFICGAHLLSPFGAFEKIKTKRRERTL